MRSGLDRVGAGMKAHKVTRTFRVTIESVAEHLIKEDKLDPSQFDLSLTEAELVGRFENVLSVTLHECESYPTES